MLGDPILTAKDTEKHQEKHDNEKASLKAA